MNKKTAHIKLCYTKLIIIFISLIPFFALLAKSQIPPYYYSNPLLNSLNFTKKKEIKTIKILYKIKKKSKKQVKKEKIKKVRNIKSHKKNSKTFNKRKKKQLVVHENKVFSPSSEMNDEQALSLSLSSNRFKILKTAETLVGKPLDSVAFLHQLIKNENINNVALSDKRHIIARFYQYLNQRKLTFEQGKVKKGDFVFFHNTRDLNKDNKNNDFYTLVGVVHSIKKDGTIVFIAPGINKVEFMYLNISHRKVRRDERKHLILNSFVRPHRLNDPAYTNYLAGELFAGFARIP